MTPVRLADPPGRPPSLRARLLRFTAGPTAALLLALLGAPTASAASVVTRGPEIRIAPAQGEIRVDGDLGEPAWNHAAPIEGWLETNPGDNQPARVANRARLAYDRQFLYAAFEFHDPEPASIRAPLGDRDNVPSYTDYGGLILDTAGDGRTAMMFLANPRGVQYDAITADGVGEDSSPDFYWDVATRITEDGWNLEMRIPFSTLRYSGSAPQMGVLLYRNWPREFRTQMFAGPLPRDEDCFICHGHPLTGFADLPEGGSLVVAPYATADRSDRAETPGAELQEGSFGGDGGVDVKWVPSPGLAIDATLNPDFSQIESDVPQIAANERFALFFPEKRPFFLEGIDLFSTPIDAVYTRSVTDPDWGARATGRAGATTYTVLVADDQGGGSVILPGPNNSSLVEADFASTVAVARVKHDFGEGSFVSLLATERQIEGGAFNRVVGPDLRWRPTSRDTLVAQVLVSRSATPVRPDLADEWDGRDLSGHAARLSWAHADARWDTFAAYWDIADEFRADTGFVPQVGIREGYGEIGRTFRPESGPVRRLRTFVFSDYTQDRNGDLVFRGVSPGFALNGRWSSFLRLRWAADRVRSGDRVLSTGRAWYRLELSPGRTFSFLRIDGNVGEQVDFANHRPADGGTFTVEATFRPDARLEMGLTAGRRWLDVEPQSPGTPEGIAADPILTRGGRLLTADVARLRAQYNFNARSYLRLIADWAETARDPRLYRDEVERTAGGLGGSVLFAYKLNWQTVLFVGYADNRELVAAADGRDHSLEPADRQVFLKLGYAFQR